MNDKLTKKRALELCRDLWRWLEANPSKVKIDWPGTEGYKYGIFEMFEHGCPCCEYVYQQTKRGVHCMRGKDSKQLAHCPLRSIWPNGCEAGDAGFVATAWEKWNDEQFNVDVTPTNEQAAEISKWAKVIADAAEVELAKLAQEGGAQ